MTDDMLDEILNTPEWAKTPAPEGNAFAGTLTRQVAEHRWVTYVTGLNQCGKTSLMMTMARLAATHWDLPVTYISTEYPEPVLQVCMVAGLASVAVHRVRRLDLTAAEATRVRDAEERLAGAKIHLYGAQDLSLPRLQGVIERHTPVGGILFVDGMRGVLQAERAVDPDAEVETVFLHLARELRGKYATVASGWVDTKWRTMLDRGNPVPAWPDVPEAVEMYIPRMVGIAKDQHGAGAKAMLRYSGSGSWDLKADLRVSGYFMRVVDDGAATEATWTIGEEK